MTRVLPLPAPARMSTGPSVACTASSCCGLRSFVSSMKKCWADCRPPKHLFYRNALRQVSRLIDIASAAHCDVVGEQLHRNHFENREKQFICGWDADVMVGA